MRCHRLTRPDRALLGRGLVADREDEIHRRRTGLGEFAPVLGAREGGVEIQIVEQFQRIGMHFAFRVRAGGKGLEAAPPSRLRMASARMDRAELPVHRNRTL
jgi:hypothetical protein